MSWFKKFLKLFKKEVYPDPVDVKPVMRNDNDINVVQEIGDYPTDTSTLLTNTEGIELIKEREGFYPDPYKCPANVPTIGYGTTYYPNGKKVKLSDGKCTSVQAIEWLKHEVDEKENRIEKFLKSINVTLNSNEFSALVSFAYNLGNGPIITNGKAMNLALRSGNKDRIGETFLIYNKARVGVFRRLKVLRGLTIRRNKERTLFLKGI
jgi:lysozyme